MMQQMIQLEQQRQQQQQMIKGSMLVPYVNVMEASLIPVGMTLRSGHSTTWDYTESPEGPYATPQRRCYDRNMPMCLLRDRASGQDREQCIAFTKAKCGCCNDLDYKLDQEMNPLRSYERKFMSNYLAKPVFAMWQASEQFGMFPHN